MSSVESHVERDRSKQCTAGNELENRPRGCYVSIPNKANSQFRAKSETIRINFQFRLFTNNRIAICSQQQAKFWLFMENEYS